MSLIDSPSSDYDAIIVTVAHDDYRKYNIAYFESLTKDELILVDLKGLYPEIKHEAVYTSL
jgi:UDP-N-acetyl-D-galactosamine dehydrogenase